MRLRNILILSAIFVLFLSCDKDDSVNNIHDLIGVWERSDSNSDFKYSLTFLEDNSGNTVTYQKSGESEISSINEFYWSTMSDQITLMMNDEIISFYSFNSDGQLIISELSTLPFNRIE